MKPRTIIALATARVVEAARLRTLATAERNAMEKAIGDGKSAMRADYYRSIRRMADAIVAEYRDADLAKKDLEELISREAGDCYWTTFTHAHLQCLIASNHWLEGDDMEVLKQDPQHLTSVLGAYAQYAVEADLREYVEPRLVTGSDA